MVSISELTSSQYAFFLKIKSHGNHTGYIVKHNPTKQYSFASFEDLFSVTQKNWQPLTFREITYFGYGFKKDFKDHPENARIVSKELKIMSAKRIFHEQKTCFLLRLISRVCDSIRNFFSGFGLKTTATLASQLSAQLAEYTKKIDPLAIDIIHATEDISLQPKKLPLTQTEHDKNDKGTSIVHFGEDAPWQKNTSSPDNAKLSKTKSLPAMLSKETQTTDEIQTKPAVKYDVPEGALPKNANLDLYLQGNLKEWAKIPLFRGIIEPESKLNLTSYNVKNITALNHLLLYANGSYQKGSKEIDLSQPLSLQIIRDTLLNATTVIQTNIINWIISSESAKKYNVTADVIKTCLEALSDYALLKNKIPDRLDIAKLITYNNNNLTEDKRLPMTHLSIIEGTKILMRWNEPSTNDKAETFVKMIANSSDFSFSNFIDLIKICMQRSHQATGLHTLIEAFNKKCWGLTDQVNDLEYSIKEFIQLNGGHF